jgi:hypothetical protein
MKTESSIRRPGLCVLFNLGFLLCSSCSFLSVTRVSEDEIAAARRRVAENGSMSGVRSECTTSRGMPIVDTVFGGLWATTGLLVASGPGDTLKGLPGGQGGTALVALAAALLHFASAGYGFEATNRCKAFQRRIDEDESEKGHTHKADQEELEQLRERVRRLEVQER